MKQLFIVLLLASLSACAVSPHNYRGVPEITWHKLTPEQRMLIVDKSFQQQFGETVKTRDHVKVAKKTKHPHGVKHG